MEPMKSAEDPGPIAIPQDIAAKCTGPGQFERFDQLFRAVIRVPRENIDREEKKWRKKQAKKKASRANQ
jgi:hypothetical protein